jgi:hypothetical protein
MVNTEKIIWALEKQTPLSQDRRSANNSPSIALLDHLSPSVLVTKENTPRIDIHDAIPFVGVHYCASIRMGA